MAKPFEKTQQKAIQYWFIDGLAEIGAGVVSLVLAVLFLFWEVILLSRWGMLIFFGIALAVSVGLRLGIQKIKERTTYRQTGYVAPLTGLENRQALFIAIGFTILLLAVNTYITMQTPQTLPWTPLVAGLVLGFVFGWTGYMTGLRRFYSLAVFSLLLSAILTFLQTGVMTSAAILSALVGASLILMGARVRAAYTRSHPMLAG